MDYQEDPHENRPLSLHDILSRVGVVAGPCGASEVVIDVTPEEEQSLGRAVLGLFAYVRHQHAAGEGDAETPDTPSHRHERDVEDDPRLIG